MVSAISGFAQFPAGGNRGASGGQNMNMGHIYGKIIDSVSGKPVKQPLFSLFKINDSASKHKDVVVGGMLTTKKGEFSIENTSIGFL